jgi:hypothetical protein
LCAQEIRGLLRLGTGAPDRRQQCRDALLRIFGEHLFLLRAGESTIIGSVVSISASMLEAKSRIERRLKAMVRPFEICFEN